MNLNNFINLIKQNNKQQLINEFELNGSIIVTEICGNESNFRPMQCYANYNYVGSLFLNKEE